MKEQDLREKFDDCVIINHVGIDTDQCVQIAKDYAEQEAIEFAEWLIQYDTGSMTRKELYQLFKNIENER